MKPMTTSSKVVYKDELSNICDFSHELEHYIQKSLLLISDKIETVMRERLPVRVFRAG